MESRLILPQVKLLLIFHKLPYFRLEDSNNGCKILNHPLKKIVIYPNLLLSDIDDKQMNYLIEEALS
jgi:hypothetical protein